MARKIVMAYVPVIHRGYMDFFQKHNDLCVELYVFGDDVIAEIDTQVDYLRKEIRSLTALQASQALSAMNIGRPVRVLDTAGCLLISLTGVDLVMADEDVSHVLAERYFTNNRVEYDSVFLRWNRDNTKINQSVEPDRIIAITDLDRELMYQAVRESQRSSDWWRQIGAVATMNEGQILFSSHNHHLPSPHTPYIDGDPRNTTHRGEGLDLYTSIHAEADIVAMSARSGVSLSGAYLYSSTFPCPPCAKLIARAGFCRLYCAEDYALLDGVRTLRDAGVDIIKVVF